MNYNTIVYNTVDKNGAIKVDGNVLDGIEYTNFKWNWQDFTDRYGSFLWNNTNASYTYKLWRANSDVYYLSDSETLTEDAYPFTYTDKNGYEAHGCVIITIKGGNNPEPTKTYNTQATVQEDVTLTASGNILEGVTASNGKTIYFFWDSNNFSSKYGSFSCINNGTYEYTLYNDKESVQSLTASQTLKETFRYEYMEGDDGDITAGTLTITIKGTLDGPTVQSFEKFLNEDGLQTTSGNVLTGARAEGGSKTLSWTNTKAKYGTILCKSDGSYSYTLDNDSVAVQTLRSSDSLRETFAYTYKDANGNAATGTLTIFIDGKNDVPVVKSFAKTVVENGTQTASGNVLTGATVGDGTMTLSWADGKAKYGTIERKSNGSYTYKLNNSLHAVQALNDSQTLKETFGYTYKDGDGDMATGKLTITIKGTNKSTPKVKSFSHALTEDGTITAKGNVLSGSTAGDGAMTLSWADSKAKYGTIERKSDGSYNYRLNNESATVQKLNRGDRLTETFSYSYTDVDGDKANGKLSIIINGATEIPQLKNQFATVVAEIGNNREDFKRKYTIHGDVLAKQGKGPALKSGEDYVLGDGAMEQHSFSWGPDEWAEYGTITKMPDGTWTYVLDNDNEIVQQLKSGASLTEQFTYGLADKDGEQGQGTLDILIKADLFPEVANHYMFVDKNSSKAVTGDVLMNRRLGDGGAKEHTFKWTSKSTRYGSFSPNADGTFSYMVNANNSKLKNLASGSSVKENISYSYTDADGDRARGKLVLEIQADKAPKVRDYSHTLTEDSGNYTIEDNVLKKSTLGDGKASDHSLKWRGVALYGTLKTKSDGSFTYVLNNASRTVQKLKKGEVLTESFTYAYADKDGDQATGQLTFTINGVNEKPTVFKNTHLLSIGGTVKATGNALTGAIVGAGMPAAHTFAWGTEKARYGKIVKGTSSTPSKYTYVLDAKKAQKALDNYAKTGCPTDVFTYSWTDTLGKRATGLVLVAIDGKVGTKHAHAQNSGYAGGVMAGNQVYATLKLADRSSASGLQVLNVGSLDLRGGAVASGTVVAGSEYVGCGGIDVEAQIRGGRQTVASEGYALSSFVSSGGRQIVSKGGTVLDAAVGIAPGNIFFSAGKAAPSPKSGKGACQEVYRGGKSVNTLVTFGGVQKVYAGGIVSGTTVHSGGTQEVYGGGNISAITLEAGAKLNVVAGNTLYGKNSFSGATVTGGTAKKAVKLCKNALIAVGAKTNMKKFYLDASGARLSFSGAGSTLKQLKLNSTKVAYDVSQMKAKGSTTMLSLSSKTKQKASTFSISVDKAQAIGDYELSKNLVQTKGLAYTISIGSKKLGVAKLNGSSLSKNGVTYSVKIAKTAISLSVAMKSGKMLKRQYNGTADSDIFYGGKGNSTIKGANGRDVVVYDKTAWGKDKIVKTAGTMTILFKDLKQVDVVQTLKGTTMTFTRKGVKGQAITVQGWNGATHSVVFCGTGMKAFDKWLKASKPTNPTTINARNEVWKKAGLAKA